MFARAVARKGLKPVPKKALLSRRIDADVIEWFKAQGGRISVTDECSAAGLYGGAQVLSWAISQIEPG